MGFVANLYVLLQCKDFWKFVNIWQSYRTFKGGNFSETQCSCVCHLLWLLAVLAHLVLFLPTSLWSSQCGPPWQMDTNLRQ